MADQNSKFNPGIKLPKIGEIIPQVMKFHFIKSNFFRVVHADGVWGGVAGRGDIHISFFSERPPLPKVSSVEISPDGTFKESNIETKSGVIREVEVDVVMNLDTARVFHTWLSQKIADSEKLEQAITEGTVKIASSAEIKKEKLS